KETAILFVYCQSAGRFTGRKWPAGFYFQVFWIDGNQFALVLDVHKKPAFAGTHAEFRLAAEFNFADNVSAGRINGRGIVASAVESEHPIGRRIKQNRVGVLANGLHFADRLQRLEIEYADGAFAAVAGKPAAKIFRQGNAVNARSVGDIPD